MSTTLYVKSTRNQRSVLHLVKSTIDAEMIKLKLAMKMADTRLKPFEDKYQVSSDYFITHLAAEDLEGGDDEYVSWAGEYRLKQRLAQKLEQLKEIDYDYPGVLHAH